MYLLRKVTGTSVGKAIPWLNKHTQNSDEKRQGHRSEAKARNKLGTAELRLGEPHCQQTADLNSELGVLVSSSQSALKTDKRASRPAIQRTPVC